MTVIGARVFRKRGEMSPHKRVRVSDVCAGTNLALTDVSALEMTRNS
jgi:hypothetical protein